MIFKRWTLWDYLFWLGELVLLLWILAKLFGFIQTPLLLEMLPLLTLFFTLGVFYQKLIMTLQQFESRLSRMESSLFQLKNDLHLLDKRAASLEIKTH